MNYIELTGNSAKICMPVPRVSSKPFQIDNMTMRVTREGQKNPIAQYPVEYGEAGQICFLIDDDLTGAKPGWYIGVIRHCNKPVHTIRMRVPRDRFGPASVVEAKYFNEDNCRTKEQCPAECVTCGGCGCS